MGGARLKAVLVLLALVAAGVGAVSGMLALVDRLAGARDRVVVGSKAFTESIILAEIVSQWLEENGVPVERRFNLGATNISFEALRSGAVDMYPEYTGTGLIAILHHDPIADRDSVLTTVRAEFDRAYDLEWLEPLGFNNTYALAVPEALAARLHLTKVSDLLVHTDLRAGFASEFLAREDGWPGLSQRYGLVFKSAPSSMEAGLMYQAAASGQLDVISAYSTDGRIETQKLRVLDDDRGFFPPYEPVVVARKSVLRKDPRLAPLLRALGGAVGDGDIRRMNGDVDFGSKSVVDVARAFVATARPHLQSQLRGEP